MLDITSAENIVIFMAQTPILEITRQFRISSRGNIQILRKQFSLRPAAAKTVQCQGDTLNEVVVDFPPLSTMLDLAGLKASQICTFVI